MVSYTFLVTIDWQKIIKLAGYQLLHLTPVVVTVSFFPNVLQRPIMYDSYHGIEIYRGTEEPSEQTETVTIVGNICESGDILAKDRELPEIRKGDVLGILDAGAYGFTMASNYNNRLRPAEIMIRENGQVVLTREREVLEDLMRHVIPLEEV